VLVNRHSFQAIIGVVGRHRRSDRQLTQPGTVVVVVIVSRGSPGIGDDIAGAVACDGADRGGVLSCFNNLIGIVGVKQCRSRGGVVVDVAGAVADAVLPIGRLAQLP
jgi:hypothetical protein